MHPELFWSTLSRNTIYFSLECFLIVIFTLLSAFLLNEIVCIVGQLEHSPGWWFILIFNCWFIFADVSIFYLDEVQLNTFSTCFSGLKKQKKNTQISPTFVGQQCPRLTSFTGFAAYQLAVIHACLLPFVKWSFFAYLGEGDFNPLYSQNKCLKVLILF